MTTLSEEGYIRFGATGASRSWAAAALKEGHRITSDAENRLANLRHEETWFVGVDALSNNADGAVNGVPLSGPWDAALPVRPALHPAQLSVIYPGYPGKDASESEANHRYRQTRKAAHVDGLLPVGAERRRYAQEFHAWILGIQLSRCNSAPTVCWPGSHKIMGAAIRSAIGDEAPGKVDLTDMYQAARREVFESCDMVSLRCEPGESFLLHRFLLHGTETWGEEKADEHGRMIAFFRPEFNHVADWLSLP